MKKSQKIAAVICSAALACSMGCGTAFATASQSGKDVPSSGQAKQYTVNANGEVVYNTAYAKEHGLKTVTIAAKADTISGSFKGSKVKTVKLKSVKVKAKVMKKAVKGSKVKTIKVKAKVYKKYTKAFKNVKTKSGKVKIKHL